MYRGYTQDKDLIFKDAGAVTATGSDQVGGSAKIIDLGAARFEAVLIVDVSACDATDSNETYAVNIELSNDAGFASGNVVPFTLNIPRGTTGRAEVAFTNVVFGTLYRYARTSRTLGGTTPSINYTAWASTCDFGN